MKSYYESEEMADPKAFTVNDPSEDNEYEVFVSDIDSAFQHTNQKALKQAVAQRKQRCEADHIEARDIDKLRVLQVGGFSNLCCAERTVREAFGLQ